MRITTPHKHPRSGRPLVIANGIGGGDTCMVFAVRPTGNLQRVSTLALPECQTPDECRANLDSWMAGQKRRDL